jgi:hypothetical protein
MIDRYRMTIGCEIIVLDMRLDTMVSKRLDIKLRM